MIKVTRYLRELADTLDNAIVHGPDNVIKITKELASEISGACIELAEKCAQCEEAASSTLNNNDRVQSLCLHCENSMCKVPDFELDKSWKEYGIIISSCDKFSGTKPVS